MRDLLPPESRARRSVANRIQAVFARSGYELVTTPMFELASVFEQSSSMLDPRELLRFVEPDSGDVMAIRPDITPQIARVVATRLADHPAPWRLRYEGTVVRQRRGRARKQRQKAQAGVEHIGENSVAADVEVIDLIAGSCEAAGLEGFKLELSQVAVGQNLLGKLPEQAMMAAAQHLARKDAKQLEEVLKSAGVAAKDRRRLLALSELHGGLDVLGRAEKLVRGTAAAKPLARLSKVIEGLADVGRSEGLCVDLGEVRGASYYTGMNFHILAEGPGEAVASGGRYDRLVKHYGRSEPATGGAIDLENLLWALDTQGQHWRESQAARLVVAGSASRTVETTARELRGAGSEAATLRTTETAEALSYAKVWAYDAALVIKGTKITAVRVSDRARRTVAVRDCAELVEWAAQLKGS